MNIKELKNKNIYELKSYLNKYFFKQFNIRLKINSGKLKKTHLKKECRYIIAYIKMLIKNKENMYNEKNCSRKNNKK